MKVKKISLIFFFLSLTNNLLAQYQKSDFWEKTYFGGNVGLSFATNQTTFEISPLMGYRFTDRFSAGPGITYIYYQNKVNKYSTSIYGGRLFANYFLTERLFARSEFEVLGFEAFQEERKVSTNLFIGGGLFQPIGNSNAGLNVSILYNVTWTEKNPIYSQPYVIRIGFVF